MGEAKDDQARLAQAQEVARLLAAQPLMKTALIACPGHLVRELLDFVQGGAEPSLRLLQAAAVISRLGALLEAFGRTPEHSKPRGQAAVKNPPLPPEGLPEGAWRNPLGGRFVASPPWGGGIAQWGVCGAKARHGGPCGTRVAPGQTRCYRHGLRGGRGKVAAVRHPRHAEQVKRRIEAEVWRRGQRLRCDAIPPEAGW